MKEDPNLIFTLRAISKHAERAFEHSHNKRYYVPPHPLVIAAASRESSVATNIGDEDGEGDGDGLKTWNTKGKGDVSKDFNHQLRFTWDNMPKTGAIFGSNPKTCDVILGSSKDGISSSHFRITFNDQDRLVLIDSSTHGTAVSYDGQARKDKRKNPQDRTRNKPRNKLNDFTWILFPEVDDKRVIIGEDINELPNAPVIEFSVEVTDPESCDDEYKRYLRSYLDEMRKAIPFGLNIDSQKTTTGQTESHSPKQHPKQRPIWIDREEIRSGAFAIVYRAINVSTGKWYAAKTFMRNKYRKEWDREVAILRKVSHDHIIKFEDHDVEHKWPRLIMEYLPLGNLAYQNGISRITE
ncbi:kinase-like protein [Zopfia rhizophila CBS 207.26]|uniref:Kinase-like protein n=1 Tax=Zopfia rhizophila CBS 207.26 TaxID=1314779 RepID=A0A6A6F0B7_9PEZI|nr:kinase-like protein [Zopfia rhizophila CBS 207.26]